MIITIINKVGLLDAEQYLRASGADSFLDIKNIFWLGNRYSLSYIRNVGSVGSLDYRHLSSSSGLRPVIKISNIIIAEGDGTLVNGFQISKKSTNTSNVQVGEYINVPYSGSNNTCGEDNLCTFRVVAKDNNSIKVVLNGLLSTNSAWADNAEDNITTNDLIYTNVLNGFIENIDSEYITIGEYGVEAYQSRDDYTVPQKTTITANVGLPTIGEIFSGNDINLGTTSTKLFVDVNTIENPKKTGFYWTMNKGSVNKVGESILPTVQFVHNFGELNNVTNSLTERGVRPVIFLKNNLTFTGGDGTAQNSYTVN